MNINQYLLMKLAEECTEVAQRAMKCMQFGLEETEPGQLQNNAQRLYAELDDVMASIQMLNTFDPSFFFKPDHNAQTRKMAKVWHYHEYSKGLGLVRDKSVAVGQLAEHMRELFDEMLAKAKGSA